MSILNQIEASLQDFRPQTTREFVALQIAQRFNDRGRLARYLNASRIYPQRVLLDTARVAAQWVEAGRVRAPGEAFFRILDEAAASTPEAPR
jgi:hypothetical protein